MEKKRILIVVPYNNGTIGMCSRNLYAAMKEREDLEVKAVVVHRFKNDRIPEFEDVDFCVEKEAHPFLKWANLIKQVIWLRRIKRTFKPDVTLSTLGGCSTINVLSGGSDKKVGIFHAPHFQERSKGRIVYLNTIVNYKYIYPKLDRIACVSNEVKNSIIKSFPWFRNKDVRVVYNIHNADDIYEKAKEELTNQESQNVDENTILYIGRLDRNKAPYRALKAFKMAIQYLPTNSKLCFIGKDVCNLQPELTAFVRENNISTRVSFLGFQSNPYKFLSKAKCLISTSYSEGLPGVIIESLLLDKPVITTNSSEGIWEIMSCYNDYKDNLTSIYRCDDGIITSNNAFHDNNNENVDIYNLHLAIREIFKTDYPPTFAFKKSLNTDVIISQLLD